MKIISVGKNTKNAEGIKIPGEIKKVFTNYLKAKQSLEFEEWKNVSVELLFASWLDTFQDSEDYKTTIAEAKTKKDDTKAKKAAEKAEKKAKAEQEAKEKREKAIAKKQQEIWALEHPEEAAAKRKAEKEQAAR